MTGRKIEFDVIDQILNSDDTGGVLLVGPAGVGRTRVAREAVSAAATSGWLVHQLQASPADRSVPGGAAHWGLGPQGMASPRAAHEAIAAIAEQAATTRVLITVDDAHLLDDASVFVVHQVLQRGFGKAVITTRSDGASPQTVLGLWKDGLVRRIDLSPFVRDDCDELVRVALGSALTDDCARRLWELTQGDLVLLTHLVEQEVANGNLVNDEGRWRFNGDPSVSNGLAELVLLHAGSPAEPVRKVVELIAVVGTIERRHLRQLADREAVAEAERVGLIAELESTPGWVAVARPLSAKVALAQCGPLRAQRLRGRLASVMSQPGEIARVDSVALGVLWLGSDLGPDAELLSDAAEEALTRLDIEVAQRCALAAVESTAGVRPTLLYAHCMALSGRIDEATKALAGVSTTRLQGRDFRRYVNLAALMSPPTSPGWTRAPATNWVDATSIGGSRELDDQTSVMRALELVSAGDPVGVLAAIETVDHRSLDVFGRSTCLATRALALAERGQVDLSRQMIDEGWRVLDSGTDALSVAVAADLHVHALLLAGFVDDAAVVAARASDACAEMSSLARRLCRAVSGAVALAQGNLGSALRQLHPTEVGLGDLFAAEILSYRHRLLYAQASARAGESDEAVRALKSARNLPRLGAVSDDGVGYRLARAWTVAAQGDVRGARIIAVGAADRARHDGRLAAEVQCLQASVQLGASDAERRLGELAEIVGGVRAPVAAGYAKALATQDGFELEVASLDFERLGDVLAALDASGHASVAHRQSGRRPRALRMATRARHLARTCGAPSAPALTSIPTSAPFTSRQQAIAELILKGMTNREIAEALSLSVRTVEGHIYRSSAEAGVTNRIELADLIVDSASGENRGAFDIPAPRE